MGTERDLFYKRACSCGKGTYMVYECQPDHPWVRAGQVWYESTINCPLCAEKFILEVYNGEVYEIPRSELTMRKKRWDRYSQKTREIMEYAVSKGYLASLKRLMDSQRSVAATYRLLKKYIRIHDSEQTFRRNLKSYGITERWIERNISAEDLSGVLTLLGKEDTDLLNLVKAGKELSDNYHKPVKAVELKTGVKRELKVIEHL